MIGARRGKTALVAGDLLRSSKQRLKRIMGPLVRTARVRRVDLPPELWGLEVNGAQHLQTEGFDLFELARTWGSPLHVVRGRALADAVERFGKHPAHIERPCRIFYSYKTNPVPGVLRFLHERGVGAEVISHYELWLAQRLGVAPENIIYNGPAKSTASLREAVARRVGLINLNAAEELDAVEAAARSVGVPARVGVRVSFGASVWSGQFGAAATGEALDVYRRAMTSPWLRVVGIHVHRGSLITDFATLDAFVATILDFVDRLRDELGLELEVLDLGGSLALPTVRGFDRLTRTLNTAFSCDLLPPDPYASVGIESYAIRVLDRVDGRYRARGRRAPLVYLEPGRAMTGSAALLLCSVVALKHSRDGLDYAVLDAGINIAEPVRNEFHQLFVVNKAAQAPTTTYRLVGPICTPGDVLYPAWRLPALCPGDALAIMDSGAYCIPFSTTFSFPRPAVVMLHEGRLELLRRRETFEDLVALDEQAS